MPDAMMNLLDQLIRFRSTDREHVNNAMAFAGNWLQEQRIPVRVFDNHGYRMLTASVGEGPRHLVLNGHLDVVPAEGRQFSPETRNGCLYGRGAYDMLGGCSAFMDIMSELRKNPPAARVTLMLVPTEETDSDLGTRHLLARQSDYDFAICGEPTNLNIAITAKGILRLKLAVHGKAAHSSRPWEGVNAVLRATDLFRDIEQLPFAKESGYGFSGPSINLSVLEGGNVLNQVPDTAVMKLDIRFLPSQSTKRIVQEISELAGTDADITIIEKESAVNTPEDNPFVRRLAAAARAFAPKSSFAAQHGSADTRYFQAAGIPSVEFGPAGAGHHGPDEHLVLESLHTYRSIVLAFILGF